MSVELEQSWTYECPTSAILDLWVSSFSNLAFMSVEILSIWVSPGAMRDKLDVELEQWRTAGSL